MIPGRTLHRLAAAICSEKTLERIVEPAIADLQNEYATSTSRHLLHQVWTLGRGYSAVVMLTAVCAVGLLLETDEERDALARTFVWSMAFTLVGAGFVMLPALWMIEPGHGSTRYLVLLAPSAIPLAIPIGLTFGVALGLAGYALSRPMARRVLLVALAASLASFVTLEWIMPAANQTFREERAWSLGHRGHLTKGPNEMTLVELSREIKVAVALGDSRNAHHKKYRFHMRLALSIATVPMAAFLLVIRQRGHAARGLVALVICAAYWILLVSGEAFSGYDRYFSEFGAAWLPNIVLAMATIVVMLSRSSRFAWSS